MFTCVTLTPTPSQTLTPAVTLIGTHNLTRTQHTVSHAHSLSHTLLQFVIPSVTGAISVTYLWNGVFAKSCIFLVEQMNLQYFYDKIIYDQHIDAVLVPVILVDLPTILGHDFIGI